MKDQQQGLMEEDIFQEEIPAEVSETENQIKTATQKTLPNPQKALLRFKNYVLHLKRPKIISIVTLLILIIVIYFALALLSTRKQEETPTNIITESTKPSTQVPIDSKLAEIAKRIETYNKKFDNLDSYSTKLPPPSIDLEIEFN